MKNLVTGLTLSSVLFLGLLGFDFGCGGGGGGGGGHTTLVIVEHNGTWGYYIGVNFCDFTNNWCNTGLSYGITDNGCLYNGVMCTGSGGSSGGGSTGGGGGSTGGGGGSTGGGSTGGGGGSTGGGGGSTGGGGGSTGGGGGSTGGGGGSTGGGGGSTGGGGGSTGGGGGSTGGGGGSTGGGGGSTGGGGGSTGGGGGGTGSCGSSGCGPGTSVGGSTKDVDLQRASVQQAALDNSAAIASNQYNMDFESARQLVQLSNQMSRLASVGQLTDEDRGALAQAALGVAHVSNEEVAAAVAEYLKTGDHRAIDILMDKAAKNVGMPNSASLRDQILPSLGIVVP